MATLTALGDGLWHAEKDLGFGWHNGMYVARLASGGLLVHSPTRLGTELLEQLAGLGDVEVLFAPNHFHHLGLPAYRERFPQAAVVASERASARLRKKGHVGLAPIDAAAERLPPGARFLVPAGTKNGEAWLSLDVDGARTWIICDALFHETRPLKGARGVMLRWLSTAPGLCIGATFDWLGLEDRAAFRAWLERTLDEERPARILPSHGTPYDVGDGEELRALIARRLRA
ncbi:MAG: hypothetical protein KF901_03975 [Myxococcales bacterium]|nr:hypothetical protein [Myxococcales bacterium]